MGEARLDHWLRTVLHMSCIFHSNVVTMLMRPGRGLSTLCLLILVGVDYTKYREARVETKAEEWQSLSPFAINPFRRKLRDQSRRCIVVLLLDSPFFEHFYLRTCLTFFSVRDKTLRLSPTPRYILNYMVTLAEHITWHGRSQALSGCSPSLRQVQSMGC